MRNQCMCLIYSLFYPVDGTVDQLILSGHTDLFGNMQLVKAF